MYPQFLQEFGRENGRIKNVFYFGNWFNIVQKFVPKTSIFEFTHPYRTTNNDPLMVWDRVRQLNDTILGSLVMNSYVARLDESIFNHSGDDEIDEDDADNDSTVVPFQVAYAVSIHKAQGLEYDSVKIIITNETEERITHNIFCTAFLDIIFVKSCRKKLGLYINSQQYSF